MNTNYLIDKIDKREYRSCFTGDNGIISTSQECSKIFDSVIKNMSIYEQLYRNKVYKIDTTLENVEYFITIGQAKLLHLLGFDFYSWQKNYKVILKKIIGNSDFSKILNIDYIDACKNDSSALYEALQIITEKSTRERLCEIIPKMPELTKVFNMSKIKTKNFAFERLGLLERASGLVIYDKFFDINAKNSKVKSDLFILKDIDDSSRIFPSQVNWIFNGYAHPIDKKYKAKGGKSMSIKSKNAETLLIEKDSSSKFDNQLISLENQLASVVVSVGSMKKSDFMFAISDYESGGDGISDYFETEVIFSEFDIENMIDKMEVSFPKLNFNEVENYRDGIGRTRHR